MHCLMPNVSSSPEQIPWKSAFVNFCTAKTWVGPSLKRRRKSWCNLRRCEFCNPSQLILQSLQAEENWTYREYWVWRVDSTCGWLHFRLHMCNWLGLFLGLELWSSDHLLLECNWNLARVGLLLYLLTSKSVRKKILESPKGQLVIISVTNWQKSTNHHSHPWFWHSFGWMASQLDLAAKFYTLWVWRHLELFP